MDKLLKFKSLLDAGLITRNEYDEQKNFILHGTTAPTGTANKAIAGTKAEPADTLQAQLLELKGLYESGAISEQDYDTQKKLILRGAIYHGKAGEGRASAADEDAMTGGEGSGESFFGNLRKHGLAKALKTSLGITE